MKKQKTNAYVRIKYSKIHGSGGFAKKDIKKGARLIEYIGRKVTKEEAETISDKGGVFLFEVNKKWDIDGNVPENIARFINHSCNPNCNFDIKNNHIWIKAKKDIKKGEELSYNYGFDFEDHKRYPCRCGAHNCIGYILCDDHWGKIKAKWTIEKLKRKDIAQAAKVYNKGLSMEIPPGKATLEETKITLRKVKCFVYKEKRKIQGLITFTKTGNSIIVEFICSLKLRKGIGRNLMIKMANSALKENVKTVYSNVSSKDKRVINFYDSCGFKKYGQYESKIRKGFILNKIKATPKSIISNFSK